MALLAFHRLAPAIGAGGGEGLGREVGPRRGGRGKEGEEAAEGEARPARLGLPPAAAAARSQIQEPARGFGSQSRLLTSNLLPFKIFF